MHRRHRDLEPPPRVAGDPSGYQPSGSLFFLFFFFFFLFFFCFFRWFSGVGSIFSPAKSESQSAGHPRGQRSAIMFKHDLFFQSSDVVPEPRLTP